MNFAIFSISLCNYQNGRFDMECGNRDTGEQGVRPNFRAEGAVGRGRVITSLMLNRQDTVSVVGLKE